MHADTDTHDHHFRAEAHVHVRAILSGVSFSIGRTPHIRMQEYVRGARLDAVLHHRARVFQDSVGSSASFAMSTEVDRLSAFLSHTWSAPRNKKFMALCMHYNANLAFVAVLFGAFLLSVGIAFELFPLMKMAESSENTNPVAPYATVVSSVVFQVVMHMAHEVLPNSSRVFLDNLCIHQTDTERKLDGVAHLGLTMFFSSTMVVLDSESYFNRLWTVYEFASCLVVDSGKPIVFLPVNLPVHVHGSSAAACFAMVLYFLLNTAWAQETFPSLQSASIAVLLLLLFPFCLDRHSGSEKMGQRAGQEEDPSAKFQHQGRGVHGGARSTGSVREHRELDQKRGRSFPVRPESRRGAGRVRQHCA